MSTVLLLRCPDQPGIVAAVGQTIAGLGGNIVHADQHTDRVHDLFLQRVEATFPRGADVESAIVPVAEHYRMTWSLHRPGPAPRVAVLVSKQAHCLADLLSRVELGELDADVALVASNHEDHADLVAHHGVAFHHFPVGDDPDAQASSVDDLVRLCDDLERVVLARAVRLHLQHRVLTHGNRTVVFD